MATKTRILRNSLPVEVKRTVLREAETRYRQEHLDWDEREQLWNRILRLRRSLYLTNV